MLANHWFRDVNDVRSEPMGFQIKMHLKPKGNRAVHLQNLIQVMSVGESASID